MLRLTRNFSLKNDVFKRIPPEQLRIPEARGKSPSPEGGVGQLSLEDCRVAIVGQERGGLVLVCRDGYDKSTERKTFIDLYDVRSKELVPLYVHENLMNCVGASLSERRSLLAFTSLTKFKRKPRDGNNESAKKKPRVIFQSYIVEVHETGRRYKLNIRHHLVQRVQFLYGMKNDRKDMAYLLFFLDTELIHLYQIATKPRDEGGVRIATQPRLVSVIAKKFVWFDWETQHGLLYLIQQKQAKEKNSTKALCSLMCYSFPDKKGEMLFELPFLLEIPAYIDPAIDPLTDEVSQRQMSYFHGIDRRARSPTSRYMHIVRMSPGVYCLCQQHVLAPPDTDIRISVFIFHQHVRMDFSIPVRNIEYAIAAQMKVFFSSMEGMLLLFIPNFYFHLIDCGDLHDPRPGMQLLGAQYATALPSQRRDSLPGTVLHWPAGLGSKSSKGGMLDTSTGTAYEYHYNRECILDLFTATDGELDTSTLLQALHLAIAHMKDTELVNQIMSTLCFANSPNLCASIFKEYLVGTPVYLFMKQKTDPQLQTTRNQLLSVLSTTIVPGVVEASKSRRSNLSVSTLSGYHVAPANDRLVIKPVKSKDLFRPAPKFKIQEAMANDVRSLVELQAKPTKPHDESILRRFNQSLTRLFSRDEIGTQTEAVSPSAALTEDEESSPISAAHYIDLLASHLVHVYNANPRAALKLAKDYRELQTTQVNRLMNYIGRSDVKDPSVERFHVMENLHIAIEDLMLPCPKGFSREFLQLGYKCLPRIAFEQYVDRGVLRVNAEFVDKLLPKLYNSENDRRFKLALISKVTNRPKAMSMMRRDTDLMQIGLVMILNHVRLRTPNLNDLNEPAKLELTNAAPFIPLAVMQRSLEQQCKEYIKRSDASDSSLDIDFLVSNCDRLARIVMKIERELSARSTPASGLDSSSVSQKEEAMAGFQTAGSESEAELYDMEAL